MRVLVIGAAALLLAGCATQYGDMGYTGGVRADQMTATTYRIVSRGNAYTGSTTIADFAIRKAAETTLESGHEWFMILGSQDQTRRGVDVTRMPTQTYGTAMTTGAYTTYNATTYGGQTTVSEYFKPGQDVMIEVGRGQRPAGAIDAAEVLQYVVARTGG